MSDWLIPGPLFNPVTSGAPPHPHEIFAGPYGLLLFVPLVLIVLLVGRRWPRTALIGAGLLWLLPTLQLPATLVLLGWLAGATLWIQLLAAGRRRGLLSRQNMIALVWIGMHALVLPLWWHGQWFWYPSRMAALHNVGFAYFLLRFIAWGVQLAEQPSAPLRLRDTIAWLLYPACMRLGPVMLRDQFLARFDQWDPRRSPMWLDGLRRFGLFVLGGVGLALAGAGIPKTTTEMPNFYAAPGAYATIELLAVFYLVPIQVYLLLWTYNELAAALSRWIGICVDDNFDHLPLATSVRDFWRRWHVTVGAWLRNYMYIPLGGNRRHVCLNYVAVFAYCGVWHGASWSFLAWGLSQGVMLCVQRVWDRVRMQTGLDQVLRGRPWTVTCWLLTVHYQLATIVVFTDFDHLGLRLFGELAKRTGVALLGGGQVQ